MTKQNLFLIVLVFSFSLMTTSSLMPADCQALDCSAVHFEGSGEEVFSADPQSAQSNPAKAEETADWHIDQGDLAAAAGDLKTALQQYQKALKLEPKNLIAQEKTSRMQKRIAQGVLQDTFNRHLKSADDYYEKNDIRFAFLSLVEALRSYPEGGDDVKIRLASWNRVSPGEIEALVIEYAEELKDIREQIDRMMESESDEPTSPVDTHDPEALNEEIDRGAGGKKIGMYIYELPVGSGNAFVLGGLAGLIVSQIKTNNDMPYYDQLRNELIQTSDAILKENDFYQHMPVENLQYYRSDELLPLETFLEKNDLHACLSVKTLMGIGFGWKKKVNMAMHWKISFATGHEVKIKTFSKSQEAQGMFPDLGDPGLQPVWLELARENTLQFLEKFDELMKNEGILP